MKQGYIVLLAFLVSPNAVAECAFPVAGVGTSRFPADVSKEDRRELESLLGTQLAEVACGRMQRERSFAAKRGFFVLTADEALFVSDRKVKEILFRTRFPAVRYASSFVFGPGGVDNTQFVSFTTDDGRFKVELGCSLAAQRVVDEFDRRTVGTMQPPPLRGGPGYTCN
jgi:hypothetical protein